MRSWAAFPITLVFFLTGCGGEEPRATSEDVPAAAQVLEVPEPRPQKIQGMANAVLVGNLLFGGQPAPETLADLAGRGYKTVLNTRGRGEIEWDERAEVETLGMKYVSIPMPYPIESITDEQVEAFAELMKDAERPMVTHCGSGNRVAGLWAVWLAEHGGLEPERALELGTKAGMTRIRPVVEKRLGIR